MKYINTSLFHIVLIDLHINILTTSYHYWKVAKNNLTVLKTAYYGI